MNEANFNNIIEKRIETIRKTLASKGKEYSTDDNKLHNFDKASRMSGLTREQALKGMLLKHGVSISDIIERTKDNVFPSIEVINEKVGDIINYYILLEACLVDRQNAIGRERSEGMDTEIEEFRKYPLSKEESILTDKTKKELYRNRLTKAVYVLNSQNDFWVNIQEINSQLPSRQISLGDFVTGYELVTDNKLNLVEGQNFISKKACEIVKALVGKKYQNQTSGRVWEVKTYTIDKDKLILRSCDSFGDSFAIPYFTLMNEELWKQEDS